MMEERGLLCRALACEAHMAKSPTGLRSVAALNRSGSEEEEEDEFASGRGRGIGSEKKWGMTSGEKGGA